MFENRHIFKGELNGISTRDLKLKNESEEDLKRYSVTKLEERLEIINNKIEESQPFIEEYFSGKSTSDYFKSNLNSRDELSENNSVCKEIETWANYLLGSEEIRQERREKKQIYRFYIDKTEFNNLTNKEESLDGKLSYTNSKIDNNKLDNDNLIIDFLLKKQGNKKKPKTIIINKSDLQDGTYCSKILSEYNKLLDFVDFALLDIRENKNSKFKGKRYKLTKIKKDLNYDMIYCKKHLKGMFGEKLKNELPEHPSPSWEKFDWHEENHVKELLFLLKEFDPQDDLSTLVLDLELLLEKMSSLDLFTEEELMVISCIRNGFKNFEIAEILDTYSVKITRVVNKVVKKIVEYTLNNWKIGSF